MYTYIELTMAGSPGVTLQEINRPLMEKFYDLLLYKFNQFKRADNPSVNKGVSDADELERWHDLLMKGVITQEEFNAKKKELLGL